VKKDLLTTGEVARSLGVTINTVKAWIRMGRLEALRLPSGHFRVPRSELERLLAGTKASLRAAHRDRQRAWDTVEEWKRTQPVEEREMGELLAWVSEMLSFAAGQSPVWEPSIERKVKDLQELDRALAHVSW
jgi:excisionase family DNA binding protein